MRFLGTIQYLEAVIKLRHPLLAVKVHHRVVNIYWIYNEFICKSCLDELEPSTPSRPKRETIMDPQSLGWTSPLIVALSRLEITVGMGMGVIPVITVTLLRCVSHFYSRVCPSISKSVRPSVSRRIKLSWKTMVIDHDNLLWIPILKTTSQKSLNGNRMVKVPATIFCPTTPTN